MSGAVDDSVKLVASLDPQLACIAARAWGKLDCVTELYEGRAVEGGEVKVWAVRILKEGMAHSSQTQLLQKCGQWRATLISALQTSSSVAALEEVSGCVSSLVSRAHSLGTRDFSIAHLPPLLSSLLQYREAAACLQVAVLPAVSTIFHCYPTACKNHRSAVLQWGKEGLMNSDPNLSHECIRLLVVTHQNPEHWRFILTSSLSSLSSALLHFSLTLSQTTPLPDDLNLDLPPSEPSRSAQLLKLITSHSRLLSNLLLSPPPSPLSLPLGTLVGVVTFGLRIGVEGVVTTATDSTLLLSLFPLVHSSLLTLLTSLVTSTHSHLFPFSTAIDTALLRQTVNKGGVAWRRCVTRAVCAWVRVRGEGGKGDVFLGPTVRWLLKCCHSGDEGQLELGLEGLCVVMGQSCVSLSPPLTQEVWEVALETLSKDSQPSSVALGGVRLLRQYLEYPGLTPLSRAVKLLQNLTRHSSSEVCEESRQSLALCSLLLHPVGPPWGSHSGLISEGVPPTQPSTTDPMDMEHSVIPTFPPSAQGVNSPAGNGSLREPQTTWTQPERRKRRREEEQEEEEREAEKCNEQETATSLATTTTEDASREGGCERGEEWEEGEKERVLGSVKEKNTNTVVGEKGSEGGKGYERKKDKEIDVTVTVGSGDMDRAEEGEGREGKEEVGEEAAEMERETDDSDVEDILATFCSSPSHTDSSS